MGFKLATNRLTFLTLPEKEVVQISSRIVTKCKKSVKKESIQAIRQFRRVDNFASVEPQDVSTNGGKQKQGKHDKQHKPTSVHSSLCTLDSR